MNILMISYWDFQEHGMQVILRTPIHFARAGHRVTFLVHSEQTAKPSPLTDLHPNLAVRRFSLPLRSLRLPQKVKRIRQIVLFAGCCLFYFFEHCRGNERPDVIYAGECDAIIIGSILKRIFGIPLVTRFYGVYRLQKKHAGVSGRMRGGLAHWLSRIAMSRPADMVIMTNDGTDGPGIAKRMNPHAKDVRFWRNGIDEVDITGESVNELRESMQIDTQEAVIMTLCRLDAMKRVDRAIRALHYLKDAGVEKCRLVVVGHGPERKMLEKLAGDLGIGDDVVFAGAVRHEDIYRYYLLADVFLSVYDGSNAGNPLWEAMNAGRCIVTLDAGGTRDIIQDGVNGRILPIDCDDESMGKELARAIKELLDKPDLRGKLAAGAKAYAAWNLIGWEQRLQVELEAIVALVERRRSAKAVATYGR